MVSKGSMEEVAQALCEQLREMTGAQTSAYVFRSEVLDKKDQLLHVCPTRRFEKIHNFFETYTHEADSEGHTWITTETELEPDQDEAISALGVRNLLIIDVGQLGIRRGSILLFNLVDECQVAEVLAMMDVVGPSIVMCIDNCRARELIIEQNRLLEKRVEERTKALEAAKAIAEEANHAKSEFLSVMSHEMRTPLNPIIGFSSMMLEDARDEEDKKMLEAILASGKRQLALVDNIPELQSLRAKPCSSQAC
jgi:signal transduction histidine kinase